MRLTHRSKLHKIAEQAARSGPSRYDMAAIHFDAESKRLTATDGHIMAAIPCDPEQADVTGPIPAEAYKLAEKEKSATISANGSVRVHTLAGYTEMQRPEKPFPRNIVPQKPEGPATVSLDLKLLVTLYEALRNQDEKSRTPSVSLWIQDDLSAVTVVADGNTEAVGLIMPVKVFRR